MSRFWGIEKGNVGRCKRNILLYFTFTQIMATVLVIFSAARVLNDALNYGSFILPAQHSAPGAIGYVAKSAHVGSFKVRILKIKEK